jgi:preprotein translocase subunit Sec61beta
MNDITSAKDFSTEDDNKIVAIKDLFGKERFLKKGKVLNERAGLIKYFHERARNKLGDPFDVSYIGMLLAHLTVQDLYAFKSMLDDRERTLPNFNWNKTFFGMIKFRE